MPSTASSASFETSKTETPSPPVSASFRSTSPQAPSPTSQRPLHDPFPPLPHPHPHPISESGNASSQSGGPSDEPSLFRQSRARMLSFLGEVETDLPKYGGLLREIIKQDIEWSEREEFVDPDKKKKKDKARQLARKSPFVEFGDEPEIFEMGLKVLMSLKISALRLMIQGEVPWHIPSRVADLFPCDERRRDGTGEQHPCIYALVLKTCDDGYPLFTNADISQVVERVDHYIANLTEFKEEKLDFAVEHPSEYARYLDSVAIQEDGENIVNIRKPDAVGRLYARSGKCASSITAWIEAFDPDDAQDRSPALPLIYIGYAKDAVVRAKGHGKYNPSTIHSLVERVATHETHLKSARFEPTILFEFLEYDEIGVFAKVAEHLLSILCHSYVVEGGMNGVTGGNSVNSINSFSEGDFLRFRNRSPQWRVFNENSAAAAARTQRHDRYKALEAQLLECLETFGDLSVSLLPSGLQPRGDVEEWRERMDVAEEELEKEEERLENEEEIKYLFEALRHP